MREFINNFINSSDKPAYNSAIRWMWRLFFGGLAFAVLVFIGLSFTDLPSVEQLENPKSELASQVFAANGEVLGRYYTENRVPVSFEQLSPHLVNALVATEDERFFEHTGIDFKALGRVFVKTFLMGQKSSGGASTITQQLARLLFTGERAKRKSHVVVQKLKEWIIAVRLERKYTKEEIISMYLNKFDFINGAHGIKAASEIYFGKSQDSLELHEAAVLVGMLKNPSLFNPLRRPEAMLQRRMVVLKQMEKNELLTNEQYETIRAMPLGMNFQRQTHVDGLAPYFRMELAKYVKNILNKPENLKSDGSPYDIYRDGLRIYSTIDPVMQRIAEEEMVKSMTRVQKTFWNVWKKMDPWTYRTSSPNETPIDVRAQGLKQLIRNSDRYQGLRSKYLGEMIESLKEAFPDMEFNDDDREIERLVAEYEDKKTLAGLVSRKIITQNRAAKYRQVINSRHFPELKSRWEEFQEEVNRAFNTPVENMRVFAYNDQMETDTTMTPLDSIRYHRMFLQTGVLAVDPTTGHVKVWIGGVNHKYFQFDHIQTNRQVGSTFKPFVYATAIDKQGFSPCYLVYDLPVTIGPGDGNFHLIQSWTPKNADGVYTGDLLTLKEGLRKSKNTVSTHLMKQLGDTGPIIDLLDRMGISKEGKYPNGNYRVPRQPSICLGATDLTVMEMTGAYTTFANNGIYNKPVFVTRIEDRYGHVIYEEYPDERPAISPNANYVMVEMLRYAGAGMGLKSDVGGKTGTTNDYVDGWFMGVTPNLVVGTWVGGEDRWIRFRSITYGQGAYMAKPFFKEFIKRLESEPNIEYDPSARFFRPSGDLGIELDCSKYQRSNIPLDDQEFNDEFSQDMFGDEAQAPRKTPIDEDQFDNNQNR
jgi:penicillin-binding protein 1A